MTPGDWTLKDVVTLLVLALVWLTEIALVVSLREATKEIRQVRRDVPIFVGASVLVNLLLHAFGKGPKDDS